MAVWDPDRQQIGWGVLGIILGIILVLILYEFIGTLAFAIFVYYATRPIYQRLNDRLTHPDSAATLTILIVVGPMLLVLAYTALIGLHELTHLFRTVNITQYDFLDPYIRENIVQEQSIIWELYHHPLRLIQIDIWNLLIQYRRWIFDYFDLTVTILLRLFLLLSFTFYLLRDDHKIAGWLRNSFEDRYGVIDEYMTGVDSDLRTLYFGNLVHVLVIALFAFVTYQGLNTLVPANTGIPVPTLLALLTGIGSLIPIVGMKIVYFPVTIILLFRTIRTDAAIWFPVVFFVVTLIIVDTIPDFIVRAYVSGRGMHFGMVMFAYVLGVAFFGWYGLFLGPIVLVMSLHFARTVFPELIRGEKVTQ